MKENWLISIDEDCSFEHHSNSTEDSEFDAVVAALEELIFSPSFQDMQSAFAERHCGMLKNINSSVDSK